jgi:Tol biopolymer transport system component
MKRQIGSDSMFHMRRLSWIGSRLLLLGSIALSGCEAMQHGSTPTPPPSPNAGSAASQDTTLRAMPSETPPPAASPTTATTPTPAPSLVNLDELPSGQYIVYFTMEQLTPQNKPLYGLHVVSTNGLSLGRLAWLGRGHSPSLSPDRTSLAFYLDGGLQIMSLQNRLVVPLPGGEGCWMESWSPDGRKMVALCGDIEPIISILDPQYGERMGLIAWGDPRYYAFSSPEWSPDGEWIAYRNDMGRSGQGHDARQGLFLTSTGCLSDISTCQAATRGPFGCYDEFSWSPDSQLLACGNDDNITLLNLDGRVLRTLPTTRMVWGLAWSPDGKWIAMTMDNPRDEGHSSVYLISIDGKEIRRLTGEPHKDQDVQFWVTIP